MHLYRTARSPKTMTSNDVPSLRLITLSKFIIVNKCDVCTRRLQSLTISETVRGDVFHDEEAVHDVLSVAEQGAAGVVEAAAAAVDAVEAEAMAALA